MSRVEPQQLLVLQNHVEKIRNFCILAHVDHGKTTLSDSLVSSNGIISARLAGKLRFLDSTEEEQKRGITMHSSAIALLYRLEDKTATLEGSINDTPIAEEYLINLVDSPGHIDFSSDVSTAARLCDGALIIVDVLEGVCTQTHAVIYKALRERMRPCLVLNKIDRLIVELKLTPNEAFQHLRRIIENVNALAITLVRSELMKEMEETTKITTSTGNITAAEFDINDDEHPLVIEWSFAPEKGNIQFASALDGWGFGLMKFINYYHKKLGLNKNILRKYLFDDYSINLETKKIVKIDYLNSSLSNEQKIPMFVTLVLEPLWEIYNLLILQSSLQSGLDFVKQKFNIVLPNKEINPRDLRLTLQSCMRRWLPLADSILRMVVKTMPNPREAQKSRVSTLLVAKSLTIPSTFLSNHPIGEQVYQKLQKEFQYISNSIEACATEENAPLIVFISKMMSIRVADLSKEDIQFLNQQRQQKAQANNGEFVALKSEDEIFMALGRIFSGRLSRNRNGKSAPLYVLGHKHDPAQIIQEVMGSDSGDLQQLLQYSSEEFVPSAAQSTVSTVSAVPMEGAGGPAQIGCYLLLGPSAFPAESVPAGNIVGIVGLDDYILKTATITNHWCTYPLKSMTFQSKPILKVAIEPISHKDLRAVEKGLSLLYQYDPAVEIGMEDNGQHTMTCLGELHLDQCVKALTERFAKCEVKVSEPLISFRETILPLSMLEKDEHSSSAASFAAFSSTTMAGQLPPPWSDIPGLTKAKSGSIRVALDTQNIAITIQCYPLALNAANYLEKEMSIINQYDDHLLQFYSQLSRHLSLSSSSSSSSSSSPPSSSFFSEYLEKNKEFAAIWDKLVKYLQGKEDEVVSADGTTVMAASSSSSEELYQDIALLSPEAREQYLQAMLTALQYSEEETELKDRKVFEASLFSSILSIGPKACPTNMLSFSKSCAITVVPQLLSEPNHTNGFTICRVNSAHQQYFHKIWNRLHHSIVVGFQEAVSSGYLMSEPIFGIGYAIQRIEIYSGLLSQVFSPEELIQFYYDLSGSTAALLPPPAPPSTAEIDENNSIGTSALLERASVMPTGQLISEMKDHLRLVLLSCPLRIVEPIYQCDLQCDQSQIGNLYAVLSRRRGNVYKEDIIEGTSMFLLSAYLPVAQSFQFTSELLKKTSGSGTAPQLSFSHWKLLLQDPFWKPRTEEEKEEFGDMAFNDHNLAKLYINQIRKRKGLPIDEQIVVFAEKQRTLNKKK